jgi:exopolyphosphatase/guanosine-5'-triphosphate,3'-diphosphate pyrophosphatase
LSHQGGIDSRFQLEELYEKAGQFGFSQATLKAKVNTAAELFHKTRKIHSLEEDWLRYLSAGMILHEIGSAISPTRFEAHSHYIVLHADFLGMETWESEWIAQLCLKATDPRLSKKDLSFIKDKEERSIFLKLLALLRLAEALGPSKPESPSLKKVSSRGQTVKLTINGRGPSDLKTLQINQRKALFEDVFNRTLLIDTKKGQPKIPRS